MAGSAAYVSIRLIKQDTTVDYPFTPPLVLWNTVLWCYSSSVSKPRQAAVLAASTAVETYGTKTARTSCARWNALPQRKMSGVAIRLHSTVRGNSYGSEDFLTAGGKWGFWKLTWMTDQSTLVDPHLALPLQSSSAGLHHLVITPCHFSALEPSFRLAAYCFDPNNWCVFYITHSLPTTNGSSMLGTI